MTCKDCVCYELCGYNAYEQSKYFGKDKEIYITIKNNSPCKFFANKFEAVDKFREELMDKFMDLCDYNDFNKINLLTISETIDRIYDKCIKDI